MGEMKRLHVGLPGGVGYEVRIGPGALDRVSDYLRAAGIDGKLVLVSDSNVAGLYGAALRNALEEGGFSVMDLTIPAGEQSKTPEVAMALCSAMANRSISRKDCVVAFGGGVVGDLAGFAASIYMRGMRFVQIPTTLLAMVDSSVGGKTAVDLPEGKNLVGAFKQPEYVLADINLLETLPDVEWRNGLAEAAKSALLAGGEFYEWLVNNIDAVAAREPGAIRDLVVRCVTFKAGVVARDGTEVSGVRECLNYGHTLGHAIESVAGFGTFGHGIAVAEGIRFASRLAVEAIGAPVEMVREQDMLLDALDLDPIKWGAAPDEMLQSMRRDKKARDGEVRFVLLRDVGDWQTLAVPQATLESHLGAWARSKGVQV